jgi:hypothetical protein
MNFAAAVARMDNAIKDVLGDAGTIDGAAVKGMFQREYAEAFGVSSTDPVYRIRHGDVAVQVGSEVVVPDGTFRVRKIEPDGNGWNLLRLEIR